VVWLDGNMIYRSKIGGLRSRNSGLTRIPRVTRGIAVFAISNINSVSGSSTKGAELA